jgi:hypothetical protein
MELVQPVRSQTEWKQLLQLGSEEARTLFSDYEFIAQTAFNRELVLVLQLRVHIDTSLQLRTLEQDRDSIQFRVDQRRVGDRDTLAMWYMFIRVPETEEPLERVEAEVGPGYRRIELVYYPQPCVCGHTETDE